MWVRIPIRRDVLDATLYDKSLSMTCDRSVVFSGYSRFPPPVKWPPRYNWNILESGVKHHNTTPTPIRQPILEWITLMVPQSRVCSTCTFPSIRRRTIVLYRNYGPSTNELVWPQHSNTKPASFLYDLFFRRTRGHIWNCRGRAKFWNHNILNTCIYL